MPRWPDKNRHSCYILKYHLILVTKYRNPVITGIVKEDLIDLSRYYWKPLFWSDSYYIGSVGDTTEEIVTLYIESQGKKQKKNAANPAQV